MFDSQESLIMVKKKPVLTALGWERTVSSRDVIPCDMVTFCDKTCLPEILWHFMTFWEFCDKMWQSGQ